MEAGRRALNVPGGPSALVVMGVSGSGKSTVGAALAERLRWSFADGDDLHPPANKAKMAAGIPLTDQDRVPWLGTIASLIEDELRHGHSWIVACSALRRAYRDILRFAPVRFVWLDGPRELLAARLGGREGHFMPAALLDSQLATLEPPGPDEHAIRVDIAQPLAAQVDVVVQALGAEDSSQDTNPV